MKYEAYFTGAAILQDKSFYGGFGTSGIPDVIKEWILFKYFLSDRIKRMNWIFSRFHLETGSSISPNNPVNPVYIEY